MRCCDLRPRCFLLLALTSLTWFLLTLATWCGLADRAMMMVCPDLRCEMLLFQLCSFPTLTW